MVTVLYVCLCVRGCNPLTVLEPAEDGWRKSLGNMVTQHPDSAGVDEMFDEEELNANIFFSCFYFVKKGSDLW